MVVNLAVSGGTHTLQRWQVASARSLGSSRASSLASAASNASSARSNILNRIACRPFRISRAPESDSRCGGGGGVAAAPESLNPSYSGGSHIRLCLSDLPVKTVNSGAAPAPSASDSLMMTAASVLATWAMGREEDIQNLIFFF